MQIGTDIIELDRISQALDRRPSFQNKVLSKQELVVITHFSKHRQIEFIAGRFCAKEAYVKALGIGFRPGIMMTDISIMPNEWGQPEIAEGPLLQGVNISISHSNTIAMAVCCIEADRSTIHQHLLKEGISI